jgi:hypothetical protein
MRCSRTAIILSACRKMADLLISFFSLSSVNRSNSDGDKFNEINVFLFKFRYPQTLPCLYIIYILYIFVNRHRIILPMMFVLSIRLHRHGTFASTTTQSHRAEPSAESGRSCSAGRRHRFLFLQGQESRHRRFSSRWHSPTVCAFR